MRTTIPARLAALAAFSALPPFALAVGGAPAGWSDAFEGRGLVYTVGNGPSSLAAFEAPEGPRLFVGGDFTGAVGTPSPGVIAWDGRAWRAVAGASTTGSVNTFTTFPVAGPGGAQERLVVGGYFPGLGSNVGLAYYDAGALRAFPAPMPSGGGWVGGAFGWASPHGPELILSSGLFPPGSEYAYRYTAWGFAPLPPGIVSVARSFAVVDDAQGRAVYMNMPTSATAFVAELSRWDGQALSAVDTGPGSQWVNALVYHDDGSGAGPLLYAVATNGVRRLRAGVWESVPGAPFNATCAASFDDGDGPALYLAGRFTSLNGQPVSNIARLRGGAWEGVPGGVLAGPGQTSALVSAVAVFDEDGAGPRRAGLYLAGQFATAGGLPSVGIARWGRPACPADFDGRHGVDLLDVFAFLTAWFGADPRADYVAPAGDDLQDIFAFLTGWFAGC